MMQFDIAARTTKGGRPYQEDAFKIVDVAGESRVGDATAPYATLGESCFVLVADGVGGEFGGNIASGTLKDSFPAHFAKAEGSTEARLASALDSANEDLAHRKEEDAQLRHMASTLLAGAFDGKSLTFLSVGDSPIYRVRNGEIHRINADHRHDVEIDLQAVRKSLSDRRKGREKPVDQDDPFGDVWTVALSDRQRSAITSAVTGEEILHRHIATSAVRDGDVFVFASDGIELLSLEHIRSYTMTLLEEGTVDDLADALLMTVERHGEAFAGNAHDNTTFVVVKAHEDTAETTIIETPEARSATRTSAAPGFAAPPKAAAPKTAPKASSTPSTATASAPRPGAAPPATQGKGSGMGLIVAALLAGLAIGGGIAWFSSSGGGDATQEAAREAAPAPQQEQTQTSAPPAERSPAENVPPEQAATPAAPPSNDAPSAADRNRVIEGEIQRPTQRAPSQTAPTETTENAPAPSTDAGSAPEAAPPSAEPSTEPPAPSNGPIQFQIRRDPS